MAKHHVRNAPYESAAEIRQHFCDLQSLGVSDLSITHPVECSALLLEILRQARESEISIAALHTKKAGFMQGAANESPLEQMYRPHDPLFLRWMPLKSIVFSEYLDESEHYKSLTASVDENVHSIRRYRADYYVEFKAELTFSYADGALLSDLLEHLVNAGFSTVNLRFAFPRPSLALIETLRQQLAVFYRHPVARHVALRFSQLPFCFLPPSFLRPLYREFYEQIPDPSQFEKQRLLVRDIRGANNRYHEPCQSCRRRAACYAITRIEDHAEYLPHLAPSTETTIAFVGASLTMEDLHELNMREIVSAAPAQQGDGIIAILEGFNTILLFDGYFFQRYALTTFELLAALVENINVFGSSSLGALRGLELSNYGMRVDGYVYRFLRNQKPVPYHVVAQTYSEADRPVSEALITIYRFLELALVENVINRHTRECCYKIAEGLHFSQLTYRRLFIEWTASGFIPVSDIEALREFLATKGEAAFDVKRQDALSILASFNDCIKRDGPSYTIRAVIQARDKYLARLRSKYEDDYDSSLPFDWREPLKGGESAQRERPLAKTLELAESFFADMDVVVSDTSLLDQTHYFMINVVFVPFYFLGWGNSAGSGYGESKEKALVSAYGEVLERIPAGRLRTRFSDRDKVGAKKYPYTELPFYQSMSDESLKNFVDEDGELIDRSYIECTDIISGNKYALPRHGARLPSSLGMAAGNTVLEAVLYALYEVLEHDISAVWLTSGLTYQLRQVNMELACIRDEALRSLIADLIAKGHEVHFFNLINQYGIPTVLSAFYEADRQLVFTGIACRLDLQDAMAHSFHEALNGHYVSYFGSRDDRRGFEQRSLAEPRRFLEHFIAMPKEFTLGDRQVRSLSAQLDEVLKRLRQHGIDHILAIDLSPRGEYGLSAVKLVVPGMDRRRPVRRTPDFYRKCLEILRLVRSFATGVDPVVGEDWPESRLHREFSPPLQRFFKA